MKCIIQRCDLNSSINKVQSLVSSRPVLPILKMLALSAKNNTITISATDLTVGIILSIPAIVIVPGETTIPAKHFSQLIREVTFPTIELETDSDCTNIIKTENSVFKLMGAPFNDFPNMPIINKDNVIITNTADLKNAIFRISFSAAHDDSRPTLSGVYLKTEIEKQCVTLICTDGKRLAKTHIPILSTNMTENINVIIPVKSIDELHKILSPANLESSQTDIKIMSDKISFETDGCTFITKLIDGKYPQIDNIIPDRHRSPIKIQLNREELALSLKQASLFTSETSQSVCCLFENNSLMMKAVTSNLGEGTICIPITFLYKPFTIAFNPYFLLGILKHGHSEIIDMFLSDPHNPCLITDDSACLYLLMPMRISSHINSPPVEVASNI